METFRDDLYRYIKKKYKADPEYLWRRYPGYAAFRHSDNAKWFGLIMDVSAEKLWLDESYLNTASKEEKQKLRPPKEWIVPSNPKYYDIQAAFAASEEIDWKQGRGIKTGDTVYMYVAAPVSAILYKCMVTKTDIPYHFDKGRVHMTSLMKIRLLRQYPPDQFTFERLGDEYGIHAVRGPRGIPETLGKALQENL